MSVRVLHGDCREVLRTLDAGSVSAVVTDPPYHLTSIVKRFGGANAAPAKHGTDGAFARASRGFMGKTWDGGDIAQDPEMWGEVLRVMKPGAHLVAFGGTRTFHRMACAIEDAGFEIRDCLSWLYASGFPKSHDVSKGIDRETGVERVVTRPGIKLTGGYGDDWDVNPSASRERRDIPATPEAEQWAGWGTALKPAWEPIILARKPLAGTVAANVQAHGCGAINVDACRVTAAGYDDIFAKNPHTVNRGSNEIYGAFKKDGSCPAYDPKLGRWPANVCHDGSDEVEAAFATFGERTSGGGDKGNKRPSSEGYGINNGPWSSSEFRPDTGSASRFFFSGKATAEDRAGSKHPTVKPLALMTWLCRLITPPGGTILDPFAGSGTTLLAADRLGFDAIGIEQDAEYVADINRRLRGDCPLFTEVA